MSICLKRGAGAVLDEAAMAETTTKTARTTATNGEKTKAETIGPSSGGWNRLPTYTAAHTITMISRKSLRIGRAALATGRVRPG